MSASPKAVRPSVNGWNAAYLDAEYARYQTDPLSVSDDLRIFFQGFELAHAGELRLGGVSGSSATPAAAATSASKPSAPVPQLSVPQLSEPTPPGLRPRPVVPIGPTGITPGHGRPAGQTGPFQAIVDDLIMSFRAKGHLASKIDPLGRDRETPAELGHEFHQISDADLDQPVQAPELGFDGPVPLRQVSDRLREVYCGSIGVEFMHISDPEQLSWLVGRYEQLGGRLDLDRPERAHILEQLVRSETFERFLGKRYPGEKRFSLEGAESLIPLLDRVVEASSNLDAEEIVLGMAHRGRLNVLANTLGKSHEQIFTEFEENWEEDFVDGGGDVKYHRGYSGTRRFPSGKMIHLAMASNPSHLEAVAAVVEGRCRAKQDLRDDPERSRVVPVVIHGDAAIAGQGVVAELANLSQLEGYATGGTIHIVVNNMIGFTTIPEDGRSSRYCTDIAKMTESPVFHVNGEDPEAVVAVAQLAVEYRQMFKRDVYIDLWCYRRHGHNEQDEQAFTQPALAALIKAQPSVMKRYADYLFAENVINQADLQAIEDRISDALDKAQSSAQQSPNDPTIDPGGARWSGLSHEFNFEPINTAVTMDALREVCGAISTVPDGFNVHRKLKSMLKNRGALCDPQTDDGKPAGEISYADAETLAWGTLLIEGHPVRISGQDSRRGTFSHRHAVLFDSETADRYIPLNNIRERGVIGVDMDPGKPGPIGADGKTKQATLQIWDSPLSEMAVVGYDYGYSLSDPNVLVCWEAQFGDFNNGAQVIIDQFIASAESKWDRWSGLTLLLPHGYEGAGPEHSSARLERFLKLCGGYNMLVCYPSTAAQCFHMFRRQMKSDYRKPLVVMTPKSMLRVNTGHISELATGSFQELIDDPMFADSKSSRGTDRSGVKRVVMCCGKIYHELAKHREETGRTDVALVRIEQLYPFHAELAAKILGSYPDSAELVYVQEEPRNAGAYLFVADKLSVHLGLDRPRYIGRSSSPTPAVGSKRAHKAEQKQLIEAAFELEAGGAGGDETRRIAIEEPRGKGNGAATPGTGSRVAASA